MRVEIPEKEERFCFHCTVEQKDEKVAKTVQEPVAIDVYPKSRGCFGPNKNYTWVWKCSECGELDT